MAMLNNQVVYILLYIVIYIYICYKKNIMPSSIQQFFSTDLLKWLDFGLVKSLQIADRQEDLWILMPMIGDLIYRRSVLYHEICENPSQNIYK